MVVADGAGVFLAGRWGWCDDVDHGGGEGYLQWHGWAWVTVHFDRGIGVGAVDADMAASPAQDAVAAVGLVEDGEGGVFE